MKDDVICCIDAGNEYTGWVIYSLNQKKLVYKNKEDNLSLVNKLSQMITKYNFKKVAFEYISSYGMASGQTLFDTCTFIGILIEKCKVYQIPVELVFRKSVKMHLCGSVRAKDAEVNMTIRNRFGEDNTAKVPNEFYWNKEVESNEGYKYLNNDIYAAIALLCYMIEPHDIPIKNEKEMEKNKISNYLLQYVNLY